MISDAVLLHEFVGVVEVTRAFKSVAGVVVAAAWLVIVLDYAGVVLVVPCHRVAAVGFVKEIKIHGVARSNHFGFSVLVVEHHVLDDTRAECSIGLNHVHELGL